MRVLVWIFALFALVAPRPAAALTADQVAAGFVEAVSICARSATEGRPLDELPDYVQAAFVPAAEAARGLLRSPPGTPIYDLKSAPGIVLLSEPAPGRCDVMAYGPLVRPVFAAVGVALTRAEIGFAEIENRDTSADYIRGYRRERTPDGTAIVRLTGGEPGMGGRLFRFPLLTATATWTGRPTPTPPETTPGSESYLDLVFGHCFATTAGRSLRGESAIDLSLFDEAVALEFSSGVNAAPDDVELRSRTVDDLSMLVDLRNQQTCWSQGAGPQWADLASRVRGFALSQPGAVVLSANLDHGENAGAPLTQVTVIGLAEWEGQGVPVVIVREGIDPEAPAVTTQVVLGERGG